MVIKRFLAIAGFAAGSFISCQKKMEASNSMLVKSSSTVADTSAYIQYNILKGAQYCDKTALVATKYDLLSFTVKFDSSAVYQTVDKSNQDDINKLFGFSDNNTPHHEYSARFGWRWSKEALRLFAYVYNKGVMSFKELGSVTIGAENDCSIKVLKESYLFTLNGQETLMPRASMTTIAEGYKLFPYFGGDELAPHNISIWIKE